jgi:hypothetical protein
VYVGAGSEEADRAPTREQEIHMKKAMLAFVSLLVVAGAGLALAKGAKDRYLLISPHKPEDCLAALERINAKDKQLLAKMDWGCMDGDHTGYLVTNGESADAVKAMLPESERASAKVVKVSKFTAKDLKEAHKDAEKK